MGQVDDHAVLRPALPQLTMADAEPTPAWWNVVNWAKVAEPYSAANG
jgi:hypothetical protein